MAQKWQIKSVFPKRESASFPAGDVEVQPARTLEWAEIAGLVDIRPDGSWRPTAFGMAQLRKLEGDQSLADSSH